MPPVIVTVALPVPETPAAAAMSPEPVPVFKICPPANVTKALPAPALADTVLALPLAVIELTFITLTVMLALALPSVTPCVPDTTMAELSRFSVNPPEPV